MATSQSRTTILAILRRQQGKLSIMVWLFERSDESLQIETRYDNDTSEFVAIIRHPDGHEHTERFRESDQLRAWLVTWERDLETQHWTPQAGGPVFLPDGWPDRKLP